MCVSASAKECLAIKFESKNSRSKRGSAYPISSGKNHSDSCSQSRSCQSTIFVTWATICNARLITLRLSMRSAASCARARVVKLIETLADELATHLLERFSLAEVEIELCKFILPDTKHVSVRIRRSNGAAA